MPAVLEVHVFGANIGESILLRLPDGRWGLIDVHLPDLASPSSSALIQFLRERQVCEFEFFCLTHPHADHVKGALYILENFTVRRFLGFATILPAQLHNQVVKVLKLKAERLHDSADLKEVASQLLSALALVRERISGPRLWEEHLNRSGKAVGVVTAYSPKSLPRPAEIAYFKNNTRRLVTTGLSSLRTPRSAPTRPSPFAGMPLDANLALNAIFKNAVISSRREGICSYSLDGAGSCAEALSGDAGSLS